MRGVQRYQSDRDELADTKQENERLRTALKPFAYFGDQFQLDPNKLMLGSLFHDSAVFGSHFVIAAKLSPQPHRPSQQSPIQ